MSLRRIAFSGVASITAGIAGYQSLNRLEQFRPCVRPCPSSPPAGTLAVANQYVRPPPIGSIPTCEPRPIASTVTPSGTSGRSISPTPRQAV